MERKGFIVVTAPKSGRLLAQLKDKTGREEPESLLRNHLFS